MVENGYLEPTMTDPNREEKQDNLRINIKSKYERNYWTNILCISENKLKEAIKEVGPVVKDIKEYLDRKIENRVLSTYNANN
jgi:hypothetical protein